MKIIKIVGNPGVGKTTALSDLAKLYKTETMRGDDFETMLPALKAKVVALAPNTFVDYVSPELLKKIEALAETYPRDYRIYLVLDAMYVN